MMLHGLENAHVSIGTLNPNEEVLGLGASRAR
jgi:hypothetical protein